MLHRELEELTLNAWPPLHSLLYDGWLLSFSGGYTRRANSIHPLYPSTLALPEKIGVCEQTYAARGQETVFKLTTAADDAELDALLEQRGYAAAATTSVQVAELSRLPANVLPAAVPPTAEDASVALQEHLSEGWLQDFNRLSVTPEPFHPTMRRMLQNITPAHAFASIALPGRAEALGLAVAERGSVGLFDIIVDTVVRNQGLGRRLVSRLLQWGRQHGAARAYLAVMSDNAPARHLYATLGFQEQYRYCYRTSGCDAKMTLA